jgi:hypothetical protein
MGFLLQGLGGVLGIVSFVCFVMVLIKMFQQGQATLAIVCLVLLLCGIGYFVTFVVGWINSTKWNIRNIMLLWTGSFLLAVFLNAINYATTSP